LRFGKKLGPQRKLTRLKPAALNSLLAGDTGFGDGVNLAAGHPVDAAIGGIKGIANGGIALGDLMVRGQMQQSSASQYQAAGIQSLLGLGGVNFKRNALPQNPERPPPA
jgi:hypothetical protein